MVQVIIYWVSTALLSAMYVSSALLYLTKPEVPKAGHASLNYNAPHLIPLMIVVKILGPLAILTRLNIGLSDLAYAGIFYHLLLSAFAHWDVKSFKNSVPAIVGFVLLVASFATQNAARVLQSPYGPHLGF